METFRTATVATSPSVIVELMNNHVNFQNHSTSGIDIQVQEVDA
jgi:hypothetical protein